jgi:hypothetical protein
MISAGVFSQSTTNSDKDSLNKIYSAQNWTGSDYADLVEKINFRFKFRNRDDDSRAIMTTFYQMDNASLWKLNKEGVLKCSSSHESLYKLWEKTYDHVTQDFWDKNCKGLIVLMIQDGIIHEE